MRVVGIAPNGVATVKIVLRYGLSATVGVMRNAYDAIVTDPVSVRFVTYGDKRPESHTIPLITFTARSALPSGNAGNLG